MQKQKYDRTAAIVARAVGDGVRFVVDEGIMHLKVPKDRAIEPDLLEVIKANKEEIREFLINDPASGSPSLIEKGGTGSELTPLSYQQEALWMIDQLRGSLSYHMPASFSIRGPLEMQILEDALRMMIERHSVLRTIIDVREGQAFQRLLDAAGWGLEFGEWMGKDVERTGLEEAIAVLIGRPFDLARDYMLRAKLFRYSASGHLLVVVVHHIAFDGQSAAIFKKELAAFYSALKRHEGGIDRQLPMQYGDYAIWQRKRLTPERIESALTYWRQKLAAVTPFAMPGDHPRPAEKGSNGGTLGGVVDPRLTYALLAEAKTAGVSPFILMLAVFNVLLYRYGGGNSF